MVNRLTPSGNAAGRRRRGQHASQPLLELVHAQEAQVHQRGHPQAHVVQPDEDPHRVIREQGDEDLQAPGAKRIGRHRRVPEDGEHGADRAVLVVPGGLSHRAAGRN